MKLVFHKTPPWIQRLYPDFTWQIPTNDKKLYLTFDDGPIPEVTEYVLEELAKFQAKATFFVVGENLIKHPNVAKKVVEDGHTLGNHTQNHLKGWQTGNYRYWKNILRCDQSIEAFQHSAKLFRPPYGRIKRSQAAALSKYRTVMWNRLAWDFDPRLNTDKALDYLLDDAPNGSIFVFHDNVKSYGNVRKLLPEVLSYYHQKGFTFEAIPSK